MREAVALLEPRGAQHARRVLDERQRVQHPHDAALEVAQPAERVGDRAEAVGVDARRHRVDGEVAPEQVLPQADERSTVGSAPGRV